MAPSNEDFDGYRKWLGITSKQRPPTHYDLLKIALDEDDDELIQAAAEQRRHYVKSKRGQGHDEIVAEILMGIDEAEITLLNFQMRRDYDRQKELFEKRRKNRQVDPDAPRSRVKTRPGKTVGEDGGIFRTFAGIMAIVCVAFGIMAWFSLQLPWSKQDPQIERAQVPAPVIAQPEQVQIPEKVRVVESKKAESTMDLLRKKITGTKWINSNNVSFEWTADGQFLHHEKEREWKILDGQRVQITFGLGHIDTLVFSEDFTEFKQLIKGGPESFDGKLMRRAEPQLPIAVPQIDQTPVAAQPATPVKSNSMTSPSSDTPKVDSFDFLKAEKPNWVYLQTPLNCSRRVMTYPFKKGFDIAKSWVMAFDFSVPDLNGGGKHMLAMCGDDESGHDPILVWYDGPKLFFALGNSETSRCSIVEAPLRPEQIRNWVSLILFYNAGPNEMKLYLDKNLIATHQAERPVLHRPMPIHFGGAGAKGGQRFTGELRNIWFGNSLSKSASNGK